MKYVADVRLSVPQYLLAGECLRLIALGLQIFQRDSGSSRMLTFPAG